MKKKIFAGIAVLSFVTIIGLNAKMNSQKNQLTDLNLENFTALATSESGCKTGVRWTIEWNDEYQRNVCKLHGKACCA